MTTFAKGLIKDDLPVQVIDDESTELERATEQAQTIDELLEYRARLMRKARPGWEWF